MSREASPGTNQFRCNACGRYFNAQAELREHETHCRAAKASSPEGRRELEREDSTEHLPNDQESKQEKYKHGTGGSGE